MGKSVRQRRQEFLAANPICIFCGGVSAATTVEHCPPRAMFQHRQWPEGFEFPACEECNNGTSDQDLLVSMIARSDPFTNQGDRDGRSLGLMKMINRQYPDLLGKMLMSPIEARRNNQRLGIKPPPGHTHQQAGVVNVPPEMHEAVGVFAAKLSKAIYYLHSRLAFPNHGCLMLNWFTNEQLLQEGKYRLFDILKNQQGIAPRLERGGKFLNDQFEYRFAPSSDFEIFVLQACFGKGFGFVVLGCSVAGKLESFIARLENEHDGKAPFVFLQSSATTNN
jgi:hypothetical protein